jgi:hypothetical protein
MISRPFSRRRGITRGRRATEEKPQRGGRTVSHRVHRARRGRAKEDEVPRAYVLARNSRREFRASHRALREIVAEPALVLSAASRQTDFFITTSGNAGSDSEAHCKGASCKERSLSGMVLSTIPDKKYHSLLSPSPRTLCEIKSFSCDGGVILARVGQPTDASLHRCRPSL